MSTPYTPYRGTSGSHTSIQQKMAADWQRYCQTVPPEFRGHSYLEAMKPSTPRELKAMSDRASDVFDGAMVALDRLYFGK
jgi:hypothetical protein